MIIFYFVIAMGAWAAFTIADCLRRAIEDNENYLVMFGKSLILGFLMGMFWPAFLVGGKKR